MHTLLFVQENTWGDIILCRRMARLEVIRIHMRGNVVRCITNAAVDAAPQHFA